MAAEAADKKRDGRGGDNRIGAVKIADDVVAMIAALAALEVEGVPSLAGGVNSGNAERISRARLSRCVKAAVAQGQVSVDISVMLDYGFNIPVTSGQVQTRVKSAIENMTGLKVREVNVRIAGVAMPEALARE